jgi:hypothetical protein
MARTRPSISVTALVAAITLMMGFGTRPVAAAGPIHKVGAVTRHAAKFIGQTVVLEGYVLATEGGYILFSDEPTGKISVHDLPVTGAGADALQPLKKYLIEGTFLDHGLTASNGSIYHLELGTPPTEVQP